MRIIDADALCDAMYHEAFETDTDMQKWDSGCWIRYKMFENAIDEAPTVEPKRGEWIYQFRDSENEEYKCSECDYPTAVKHNYCPNCGARMKGADDGVDDV